MWGKILGALFGIALLKLPGLLIGLAIGHWFDSVLKNKFEQNGGFTGLFNNSLDEQALFRYTTFSTMGHIAKATGIVTSAHINQATQFMSQLGLNAAQQKEAQAAFRDGKAVNFPLQAQLNSFFQSYRRRKDVLQLFLEIQINTACTNGQMHTEQYALLKKVAMHLHFTTTDLDALIMALQAQNSFSQRHKHTKNAKQHIMDAYKVLNIAESASDAELKKAYKKLMAQHHPDKLMSQGVPTDMLEVAKQRTQDIQAAYEMIKEYRNK